MADKIIIEVLDDGTIKTSTDKVSMPNHSNAEQFLREMGRLAGGIVRRVLRPNADLTHHHHEHIKDGHTH